MNETDFRKIITVILLIILIVLSFFIVKPILISIIIGLILVFIFSPVYDWLNKYIKIKIISMILIIFFIVTIIFLPLWFLTPLLIKEAFAIFQAAQNVDFITPLQSVFPSLFASEQFSVEIGNILASFTTKITHSALDSLTNIILNFPTLLLQITVVLFTFFFALRDKDKLFEYVKTLMPFSKDVQEKLLKYTSGITSSLIYGQFFIGIIQGLTLGIGLFIFRVPNALFFTVLAMIAGVLPIVGTAIIYIPVAIYFFIIGDMFSAWGIIAFGIISSSVDNFLRPLIVSRKTKINSGIILISMIGGLFFFGVLGLLLGPLIISYLLILLEVYRKKTTPQMMVQDPSK
ncbi:MAG TPA: AI-2E family transporter [Bacillota bacterium]|nr:AI-2E family transporter [Bacillota bacterium]